MPEDPAAAGAQPGDAPTPGEGAGGAREADLGGRLARLALTALLLASLLGAVLLATAVSRGRSLQVDEVEHIHAAYHLAAGRLIYRDFYQGHPPGLYVLLAPLIDLDEPIASVRRARAVTLCLLFGTVGLAGLCAGRRRGPLVGAAVAGVLLLHTTFVERGMEVRPDVAIACGVVGALCLGLLPHRPPLTRFVAQGLVLGAAFLFSPKAAIATAGFGLGWLLVAVRERQPRLVLLPCLAWAAPLLCALAAFAALDGLAPFVERTLAFPFRIAARTEPAVPGFAAWPFLWQEGRRNVAFVLLALTGLGVATYRWVRREPEALALEQPLLVAWASCAGLLINPFPFPYFHVSIVPPLALLAALTLPWPSPRGRGARQLALTVALVVAAAVTSAPRLLEKAAPSMSYQLEHLRRVQEWTEPDDAVFDLTGLYFRRDAYPIWFMTGVMLQRYRAGLYPPLIPALRANQPAIVMLNYRTAALPAHDRAFLNEHFVHAWGNLLVHGFDLAGLAAGETRTIEALGTRRFRWTGAPGAIEVDGEPFVEGSLAAGPHRVRARADIGAGRLLLGSTPAALNAISPRRLYVNFD